MNSQGLIPIWVRITIDGKRSECSVKKQATEGQWDEQANAPKDKELEKYLLQVENEITRHYNILLASKDYVTAEDVKMSFKGIKEEKITFLDLLRQFVQVQKEKVEAKDLSEKRYQKFVSVLKKTQAFIKHKYKRTDVLLDQVKLNFLTDLQHYLRTVDRISHNSSSKYCKDLRQIMKYAVMHEYIPSNPFIHFKCTFHKTDRGFLTMEEIETLWNAKFDTKRLEEVRDCFIFSCFTGYAYADTAALTTENVQRGIDGYTWMMWERIKSKVTENVPLLPIPILLIEKYKNHPYCVANNKLFPVNSNQRYNSYLKEIAQLCGIKKKLTTHIARHTFATTILILNGVPIETVKELLGHDDIRSTQIYARIVQLKVSHDMNNLRDKLKNLPMGNLIPENANDISMSPGVKLNPDIAVAV